MVQTRNNINVKKQPAASDLFRISMVLKGQADGTERERMAEKNRNNKRLNEEEEKWLRNEVKL